jgi:hypothetical protein
MRWSLSIAAAFIGILTSLVSSACVPDFPTRLLHDSTVLEHPAIVAAFQEVERNLSALFVETTRDGLSFAIVSNDSQNGNIPFLKCNLIDHRYTHRVPKRRIHSIMAISK